jgi:hypothetical protein
LDLLPLGSLLSENYRFLKELELSGQQVSPNGMSFLAVGLQENEFLVKLSLPRNEISSVESLSTLCLALQNNLNLEYLDLSENEIEDQGAEAVKELLRSNTSLKFVKLDKNLISSTCFAVSLCENQTLTHFSISYNPLEFENCIALVEMLNVNMTLTSLAMKGVKFSGSANIKENLSGVLSKEEALILKLANVLRHSKIQALAIDIDPKALLQLRELENSLLKHNSSLVSLSSDNVNWRSTLSGPLLGIQKALKANLWLARAENFDDEEVPCELETIVEAKRFQNRESKTLKHFHQFPEVEAKMYSSESPNFSSPAATSPDFFSNSPHCSEIRHKESRITRADSKRLSSTNLNNSTSNPQIFTKFTEDINTKFQNFQEEVFIQLGMLTERVKELESNLKKVNNENLAAKVQELEKKDEATQNLIMLLSREINEIKARGENRENNAQVVMKIQNFEKKISENNQVVRKMQKQVDDMEIKVLRLLTFDSGEESEKSKKAKDSSFSEKSSARISDFEDRGKKVEFSGLPGATEQLVMKAIQEKTFWSAKKKLEYSRGTSPSSPGVHTFYSPDDCPSKDLHDRLMKKGLNFVPRSNSCYKKSMQT